MGIGMSRIGRLPAERLMFYECGMRCVRRVDEGKGSAAQCGRAKSQGGGTKRLRETAGVEMTKNTKKQKTTNEVQRMEQGGKRMQKRQDKTG